MIQIGAGVDEGAAGLGHLGAVHRQKAVGEHRRRHTAAGAAEHGRPQQGVEVDDVLADEVIEFGVGRSAVSAGSPVGVEVVPVAGAQVLMARHITHRRVHPHIKVFAGRIGNLETEVGLVTGDVPLLKPFLQPFLQFVGHLILQGAAAGPLSQHLVERRQVEEVMQGGFLHRRGAGYFRAGVDQISRAVGAAADLAVVAVLIRRAAARAGADDVAVGEEQFLLRVIELGDFTAFDVPVIVQAFADRLRQCFVLRAVGGMVVVETDQKTGEVPLMLGLHLVDKRLGRDSLLRRAEHDGRAVGVIRAHISALMPPQPLQPHPDVGLNHLHQMPEMNRPVGVRQRPGNQNPALLHSTSTISKSSLRAPQSGHIQSSGTSSQAVPAAMPSSGNPSASS